MPVLKIGLSEFHTILGLYSLFFYFGTPIVVFVIFSKSELLFSIQYSVLKSI